MNKHSGLAAQIAPIDCPCCAQPVKVPSFDIVAHTYRLSPTDRAILGAVWKGKGMPVQTKRIFDAIYADDPDGGPSETQMYRAFKVRLCRLRAKLAGTGISILNDGYGKGYRLVLGEV